MNYIHCKNCEKSIGKDSSIGRSQDILGDHFHQTGHREIQIFRYKLAYNNFLGALN